jgi:hypothetical protein
MRVVSFFLAILMIVAFSAIDVSAATATTVGTVKLMGEVKYSSDATHPYNKQTKALTINWKPVSNATKYQVYIKGGKYTEWKLIKTVASSSAEKISVTIGSLKRNTTYVFKVRGVNGKTVGKFSANQTLKTARIDYDAAGWKAMCRIVYHEVGKINDAMWDKPIVYVSDCVVNRYEAAKYLNDSTWAPFYKNYNSVQSMIYKSGGFMSDAGLKNDGAAYANCTDKVKLAVYGAVYDKTVISGIKNNKKIFFWCNTSYKPSSKKVAYTFTIPWGYFSIWTSYWG